MQSQKYSRLRGKPLPTDVSVGSVGVDSGNKDLQIQEVINMHTLVSEIKKFLINEGFILSTKDLKGLTDAQIIAKYLKVITAEVGNKTYH